jgi:hypothetical protein
MCAISCNHYSVESGKAIFGRKVIMDQDQKLGRIKLNVPLDYLRKQIAVGR